MSKVTVPERPASVLVMAILNMVFGGGYRRGMFGPGASLARAFAMGASPAGAMNPTAGMIEFMEREVPGYTVLMVGHTAATLLLATWLIVCGVGLLGLKPWARWGCVLWAAVIIPLEAANLVVTALWIGPAALRFNEKMFADLAKQNPAFAASASIQRDQGPWMTSATPALTVAGLTVFGLILVWVLFKSDVAAAFRARAAHRAGGQAPETTPAVS